MRSFHWLVFEKRLRSQRLGPLSLSLSLSLFHFISLSLSLSLSLSFFDTFSNSNRLQKSLCREKVVKVKRSLSKEEAEKGVGQP